jgi:hypothetical protein
MGEANAFVGELGGSLPQAGAAAFCCAFSKAGRADNAVATGQE